MAHKYLEYVCVLVYKRGSSVWIRHFLQTMSYPLEGDYLYIFESRVSGIGVTFRGDFSKEQLKLLVHEVIALFEREEPRLVEYIRSSDNTKNYVKSLKESEKSR